MHVYYRLMQMESKNYKLLQALQRAGAERINEAYSWVQNNKNMFRGEVYGPVLLEVCLVGCMPTNCCFLCIQDSYDDTSFD